MGRSPLRQSRGRANTTCLLKQPAALEHARRPQGIPCPIDPAPSSGHGSRRFVEVVSCAIEFEPARLHGAGFLIEVIPCIADLQPAALEHTRRPCVIPKRCLGVIRPANRHSTLASTRIDKSVHAAIAFNDTRRHKMGGGVKPVPRIAEPEPPLTKGILVIRRKVDPAVFGFVPALRICRMRRIGRLRIRTSAFRFASRWCIGLRISCRRAGSFGRARV